MKITLLNAVNLYTAIQELSEKPLDFASAHAVVMAKRELEPHVQFFAENEADLVKKYAEKDENGNPIEAAPGSFKISAQDYRSFTNERVKLNNVEAEISQRKLNTIPEQIKPSTLETLMKVFDFPAMEVNDPDG